jgi:HD-GYP domain-containing protein (c-di-GMP phosphodiesterase class II)
MVFDEDGRLQVAATWGAGRDALVGTLVPLETGAVSWAVRERRPLLLNGPVTDPRLTPRFVRPDISATMVQPLLTGEKLVGVLAVATTATPNAPRRQFSPGQLKTLGILAGIAATAIDAAQQHNRAQTAERQRLQALEQLRDALIGTIQTIAAAAEMRDAYTAGHERRVADMARALGIELGLDQEATDGLHLGGLVHDIGKLGVPTELLVCPRRLTDIEMSLIRTHAQAGYEILKDVAFPWSIAAMVRQHHERLDGSGYPQGLPASAICPEAKILAVADVVESMSAHRPYRPALGIAAALDEVISQAGIRYDAEVVAACDRLVRADALPLPSPLA